MSLQIRRGTGAQLANITPASGELIFTTDTLQVFVGDGTTSGGFPVAVGGSGTVTANLIGNVTGSLNGLLVSVTGNVITTNVLASGYVSATGNVSPCCWLDLEWESHLSSQRIDYMDKIGRFANLNQLSLTEIFESGIFNEIERSWTSTGLRECTKQCGSFDRLTEQFIKTV